MSKNQTYVSPEVESLEGKDPAAPVVEDTATEQAVAKTAPKEATFADIPDIIGVNRLVNATGDVATDIFQARLDRHLQFLAGKKSFKTDKDRKDEMTGFIETIGNTFRLEFGGFVVATDYFLNVVRQNKEAFESGRAFRYMQDLNATDVAPDRLATYKAYITLLVMVANNWSRRAQLGSLVDATYAIKDLPRKGKENVTQYLNKLSIV